MCFLQTQGPHQSPPQSHFHPPKPNKTHQLLQSTSAFGFFTGVFCSCFISNTEKIPQGSVGLPLTAFSHSKPASRATLLLKDKSSNTDSSLAVQNQRNYSTQFLFSDSRSLTTLNNASLFRADLEALTISLLTTPSPRTTPNLCLTRMVGKCLSHQLQTLAHFPHSFHSTPLTPPLGFQ